MIKKESSWKITLIILEIILVTLIGYLLFNYKSSSSENNALDKIINF